MTSRTIEPMAYGFDAASFKTYTQWGKVVRAGGSWVSLYLGGTFGVTQATIEGAWAVGLGVMLNYERSARAAASGYNMGKAHAENAMEQAMAFAFHGEAPLIFSGADFNPTSAEMPAVLDYHLALVESYTLGIGGAYGPRSVLQLLVQQDWWPRDWPLWHWGGDGDTIYPWAWVKQGPGPSYYNETIGLQVDDNTLYKPMKFWSGYGPDPFEPEEEDVAAVLTVFQCIDADAEFVGFADGGYATEVSWLTQARRPAYLSKPGLVFQQVSWRDFSNVVLLGPVPSGDTRHGWVESDFFAVASKGAQGPKGDPGPKGDTGPQGLPGAKGDPAPTPKSFTPVY